MHFLLSGIILSSSKTDSFPPDDIDRLFDRLQTLEPPGDLVKQLFTRLGYQPATPPPASSQPEQPVEEKRCESDN